MMKFLKKSRKLCLFLLLFYACCIPVPVRSEWFSSLGHMKDLVLTETELITSLKNYVVAEKKKLDLLTRLLQSFENNTKVSNHNLDEYLSHPINQYHLIKRLSLEWEEIAGIVIESNQDEFMPHFQSLQNFLPKAEDLQGSAEALFRLQDTYQLDALEMIKGDVKSFVSNKGLDHEDSYQLGQTAYLKEDYYHCVVWMNATLTIMDESYSQLDKFDVMDYLAFCLGKMGHFHHAINITSKMLEFQPNHTRLVENIDIYKAMSHDHDQPSELLREPDSRPYIVQYEELCRQPPNSTTNIHPHLKCYYWTNHKHPRLLLQPIKMEELWDSPYLVRFHDVLSDEEVEQIKSLAKPRLHRATVHNPATGELESAHYRVSKSAWFTDDEHEVVARVSQMISDITSLSMETAESLQVANYGVAGQYEPHYDYHRRRNTPSAEGNRIATFLIYLSDVQYGGSTVFLHPGVAAQPIKGSAVFWYNLTPSGEGDSRTRHAACPVLVGIKWVANKWIHERGQEWIRPCSLSHSHH